MANANSPYTDGDWTIPQQDGRRKESFPFDYLADGYAKLIERKYRMLGTSYTGPATVNRTSYTNLLTYSDDFSNADWTKNLTAVSANVISNPWDGQLTADKITENNTTNSPYYVSQAKTVNATPYCLWAIMRQAERNWCQLRFTDFAGTVFSVNFDLSSPAIGNSTAGVTGSSIISLVNGWYLCFIGFTPAAGAGTASIYTAVNGINITHVGVSGYGIYCAQAQLESASTPGPLIITTSTTRAVSVPNVDSVDNPSKNGDYFAFLLTETAPADSDLALGLIAFTRKYGRIPATEVEYTSRFVQRPVMDGAYIAPTYYTASVDSGVTSHIFNTRKPVSTSGSIDANVVSIVSAAHGGVAGDIAVLWWGNGLIARTPVLAAAADYFYVAANAVSAPTYACNFAQFTKNALVRYVNGNKNCSIKRSHYFYLPGYTVAGTIAVTTGADIPNYDVYTDPTLWLGRIVPTAAAATYAAIEVSAIGYYEGQPGSPILTQVVDEAQMSDALDTIPV